MELPFKTNLNSPLLSPLLVGDSADPRGRTGIDGPRRADHAKQGAVLPSVPDEVRRVVRLASCGLWRASAGIGMLCDLVAGEDHLFPAVASAEVKHMVPPFMAIPASAGIFFFYREHPCSVRLEIGIHITPWRRRKTASALPFWEGETACFHLVN